MGLSIHYDLSAPAGCGGVAMVQTGRAEIARKP